MDSTPHALTIQMLAWIAARPRSYRETMDAWRTSCPRLSIWEDAYIENLVQIGVRVTLTDRGSALLERFERR